MPYSEPPWDGWGHYCQGRSVVWALYALLSAFSLATADALSKRILANADAWIVAWIRLAFASPFLIILLCFITIPPLDKTFWMTILLLAPLDIIALVLYVRSIRISPLSLTLPFLSLTPAFLIPVGWILLKEQVDLVGVTGIGLIILGGYFLHLNTIREGWLTPFRTIFKEKGSRFMILVAMIYSVTSSLGKVAILHSSPPAFVGIYFLILAAAFSPIVLWRSRLFLPQLKSHLPACCIIGFFVGIEVFFHALAISQAEVAYMIAVKRTSILFGMAYGFFIFRETYFRQRISAGLIMLTGIVLLSLR